MIRIKARLLFLVMLISVVASAQEDVPRDEELAVRYGFNISPRNKQLFEGFDTVSYVKGLRAYQIELKYAIRKRFVNSRDSLVMILNAPEKKGNLNNSELTHALWNEIVFTGKVLAKRGTFDDDSCKFFKTTYLLVIEDLLFSAYPDIENHDTIVLKSTEGPIGTSCGHSKVYVNFSHYGGYDVGNHYLFCLTNTDYLKSVMAMKFVKDKYYDLPSPYFFSDDTTNILNDKILYTDELKEFLHRFYNIELP